MGHWTARLLKMLATWERPVIAAFLLALMLLIVTLFAAAFGPEEIRLPALIGTAGLIVAVQVIFMWGNRGMITPFKKAQNAFVSGDFEMARHILEDLHSADKADVQALTLLGNTYRQLGQLAQSEALLCEVVTIQPENYFPLYGFGRTLLARGFYHQAAEAIQKALTYGAPPVIQCDLGEAYYRQGMAKKACESLQVAKPLAQESYRLLMIDYLLCQLTEGEPPTRELVEAGLPYWMAAQERFHDTPYGEALIEDVRWLQTLTEEK